MLVLLAAAGVACVDPASYGAVPDDGKDDAPAIQRAVDAATAHGGKVCLGKGVFHLAAPSRAERKRGRLGSVVITGPVELFGVGPATVLRMSGPGLHADWRGLQLKNARGAAIHDLTIDGLEATDTVVQTHLLEVVQSSDVTINQLVLGPMRRPDQHVGQGIGGDCIRLLGKIGAEVADVSITNTTFTSCDRSGISLQRALRRVLIAHSTFTGTGDQAIDFEPTGRGAIEDVHIVGVTIDHHRDAQGNVGIAIGGRRDYPARRITLADSRIAGGGVRMIDAIGVQLLRNTIEFGARKGPTISVIRHCGDIRIAKNTIVRPAAAVRGPILVASPMGKYTPYRITLVDNVVRQETAAPIVSSTSVGGLTIERNRLAYTAADDHVTLINVAAVHNDVRDVVVAGNTIEGQAASVVVVKNANHRMSSIEVRGNQAPHIATALACKGHANAFDNVRSDGTAACKGVVMTPVRPAPPPQP